MKGPLLNSVIHLWDNSEKNGPWLNWNGVLHWKNKAYHTDPQRNLTDISTEDSTGNGAFFIPISDRSDDLNVLMVEPGMAPYEKEINGLEEMQAAVGGLITVIYPYSIKYGPNVKHTAICPPGGQRFFRLSGMGERYTEAAIREQLAAIRRGDREDLPVQIIEPPKRYTIRRGYLTQMPRKKVRGFRALYVSYLYLLNIRRPKRKQIPFSIRAEVSKLRRYQRQFRLLQEYRIDNSAQFSMLTDALQAQIDGLTEHRKERYLW